MYIMVNIYANVYSSLNQFYMASIMTIPMLIIELFLMKSMYTNKILNILIAAFNLIIFFLLIILIRKQIAVSDKEFLKSMIPHHASAILMCKNAPLKDPEIKALYKNIIASQQSEIDFMKTKLTTLKK